MSDDRPEWIVAVAEHRDTLERIADADLPLSPRCEQLLDEADAYDDA